MFLSLLYFWFWGSGDLLREKKNQLLIFFFWQIITDQHQLSKILDGFFNIDLVYSFIKHLMLCSNLYTPSTTIKTLFDWFFCFCFWADWAVRAMA